MKKRIFALVMTVALLCTSLVTPAFAASAGLENFKKSNTYTEQFADVKTSDWFHDSVAAAYEFGLMKGSNETTFNPSGNVTIIEAIILADRLNDIYYGGTGVFEQSGSPWYQVYVDYAIENKIVDEGEYSSYTAAATRKDFASILYMALPDSALSAINHVQSIPDVKQTESYAPPVYFLYNAGILSGSDSQGSFKPESNITRAEVAAIVVRMADTSMRKSLTLGTQMTAMEFLTYLVKTLGTKGTYEDGGVYYELYIAERTGLFSTQDGRDYQTKLKLVSNPDGSIVLLVWDYLPGSTSGTYLMQYQNSIEINPSLTGPYRARSITKDSSGTIVGGNLTVDPAALTDDYTPTFTDFEGDADEKAARQADFVEMLCDFGLPLLHYNYLAPYGYTIESLGFTSVRG